MCFSVCTFARVIHDLKKQSVIKSCINSKDFEENYTMKLTNSQVSFRAQKCILLDLVSTGYLTFCPLSVTQEEFSDLKTSCTRMETYVLLLECLAKDPKQWPTSEQVQGIVLI